MELEVNITRKVYAATGVCALEELRFNASAGEFLAIVGPSGAGKSTLLNIIAGLDEDVQGEVLMDGHTYTDPDRPATHVGFMFQEARLMPWLTVLENLLLVLGKKTQSEHIARRLLADVDLSDFETAYPGQLSGGMRRRLALARAFAVRPDLLLMDEPFLSLDAPTASRLRRLLMELWQAWRPTVLFVTHNLREALALADRVLFLSGRPAQVVLSVPVALSHPRDLEDKKIGEMRDRILTEHPELLSGLIGAGENNSASGLSAHATDASSGRLV